MSERYSNSDLIIDLGSFFGVLKRNKKYILISILISFLAGIFMYQTFPKKYTSEAKLLLKKSGSTNLSEINPFVLSAKSEFNNAINFLSEKNSLAEEIEIIKSPLVLDNVIKENNLIYKRGPSKGELVSVKDFLKKDIIISKAKGANIIDIAYKSGDPQKAYGVVKSIIKNYKKIYEQINLTKAQKDTEFLETYYLQAEKGLNEKITKLQKQKENLQIFSNLNSTNLNLTLLSLYDKRLKNELEKISSNELNLQKFEREIEQEAQKLKTIKEKYEWSLLVENMAKHASHIVLLQKPEIKKKHDFSEPAKIVVVLWASVLGVFMSFLLVIKNEKKKFKNDNFYFVKDKINNAEFIKREMSPEKAFEIIKSAQKVDLH